MLLKSIKRVVTFKRISFEFVESSYLNIELVARIFQIDGKFCHLKSISASNQEIVLRSENRIDDFLSSALENYLEDVSITMISSETNKTLLQKLNYHRVIENIDYF